MIEKGVPNANDKFITQSAIAASAIFSKVMAGEYGAFADPKRDQATQMALRFWQDSFDERRRLVLDNLPESVKTFLSQNEQDFRISYSIPPISLDREILKIFWPVDPTDEAARDGYLASIRNNNSKVSS